jgi:hypothetical protein
MERGRTGFWLSTVISFGIILRTPLAQHLNAIFPVLLTRVPSSFG